MDTILNNQSEDRKKDIALLNRILGKVPESIDKSEILREAHRRYYRRNNREDQLREEAITSIMLLFKDVERATEDVDSLFIDAIKDLKTE